MIAHADYLIMYSCDAAGNTSHMLDYARIHAERGELSIENLAGVGIFTRSLQSIIAKIQKI